MRFNKQLFFIFCGGALGGVVFLGITSSFSLMLYENGFDLKSISLIVFATLAYSWKFLLSPYVKKIIHNYSIKKFTLLVQLLIFILFSTLGIFASYQGVILAFINVLLLATITAFHDIICAHVKLTNFEKKELGIVGAVSNTGFRIGILLSTGVLLYLAKKIGWQYSYFYCIIPIIAISLASVFCLKVKDVAPENTQQVKSEINKSPIRNLINSLIVFYKQYPILIILLIVFSFKISDSTVNSTKVILLAHLHIDKVTIANICQIPGIFGLILGGFLAGIASYKYSISNCFKYSLLLQLLVCCLFFYISITESNIIKMAIILNISSLIFGFSNVMYRAFVDTISNSDINVNTSLGSIGSLFRTVLSSASFLILDFTGWSMFYVICALATVPGIVICYKNSYKKLLFK
ncbi:MAG: MFS transporter [Alphaproteobacteria bacterium]|nr:MFS transporter [Alphaproteobacteria bacterium]